MNKYYLVFLFPVLLFSCKQEESQKPTVDERSPYEIAFDNYNANKSAETSKAFIAAVNKKLIGEEDPMKKLDLLSKGLKSAEEFKDGQSAVGFLMQLYKDHSKDNTREGYLARLTSALLDIGQEIPGNILAKSYIENYPDGKFLETITSKKTSEVEDLEKYLDNLKAEVVKNPTKNGLNPLSAKNYVNACESATLAYPDDKNAANRLYSAAEIARILETHGKALGLLDWVIQDYPDFEKAPEAHFIKASIYDDNLVDNDKAVKYYQEFIDKYPEHKLVESAQFLIQNIDKTTEEMMQIILERAQSKKPQ